MKLFLIMMRSLEGNGIGAERFLRNALDAFRYLP